MVNCNSVIIVSSGKNGSFLVLLNRGVARNVLIQGRRTQEKLYVRPSDTNIYNCNHYTIIFLIKWLILENESSLES